MVFLPNPPVEDAAGGEADKSQRLPCEMQSLFLWGQSTELFVRRTNCTPPRNSLISLTLRKIANF